jgi:cytochrome P450
MTALTHTTMSAEPDVLADPYPSYAAIREMGGVYRDPVFKVYQVVDHDLITKIQRSTDFVTLLATGVSVPLYDAAERGLGMQMEIGGPGQRALLDYMVEVSKAVDEGATTEPVTGRARELANSVVDQSSAVLFGNEGEEHTLHRHFVNTWFHPDRVDELAPHVLSITTDLLDEFLTPGSGELLTGFAGPLPAIMIQDLIGVPPEKQREFFNFQEDFIGNPHIDIQSAMASMAGSEFLGFGFWLAEAIQDRKVNPKDDLVTTMVQTRYEDGTAVPDDVIMGILTPFNVGGQETTAKTMMSAMWTMLTKSGLQAELRADPSLVPNFIEETLRHQAPVQGMFRVSTTDSEIAGVPIPAGSLIHLAFGAAGRDPAKFDDPDAFDVHRPEARRHLAFGHGRHHCPGSTLARLELKTGFEQILQRTTDIRLTPGQESLQRLPWYRSHVLRGIMELHLEFDLA